MNMSIHFNWIVSIKTPSLKTYYNNNHIVVNDSFNEKRNQTLKNVTFVTSYTFLYINILVLLTCYELSTRILIFFFFGVLCSKG